MVEPSEGDSLSVINTVGIFTSYFLELKLTMLKFFASSSASMDYMFY